MAEREWVTVGELERLTGVPAKPVLGNWVASETVVAALEEEVRSLVEQAGPLGLDVALLDERQRLAINNLQEVEVSDGRVKSIDQEDILADHPILAELEKDLFSPNQPAQSSKEELRGLLQRGLVVQNEGVFFATSAIDQASIVSLTCCKISLKGSPLPRSRCVEHNKKIRSTYLRCARQNRNYTKTRRPENRWSTPAKDLTHDVHFRVPHHRELLGDGFAI